MDDINQRVETANKLIPMKTKVITLYEFNELSEDAKKKAIESLRDCNVDYNWWEDNYQDFAKIAAYFGISIDNKSERAGGYKPAIYFSGFGSQGDGSSFEATIDVSKLISAVQNETWKEYAPNELLNFPVVDYKILRAQKLLTADRVEWAVSTVVTRNGTGLSITHDGCEVVGEYISQDLSNIAILFEEHVFDFVASVVKELNRFLFRSLDEEYYHRTKDESIIETIESNGWTFTETGKLENE